MSTETERSLSLMEISADRRTVERLYAKQFINQEAHDYALEFLYPHQRWGYWTSNLLLMLGISLVLAGIVFFFAFNWQKMSTFHKFSTIEAGLICCLFGAWAYSAYSIISKLFLISASILIGVFLAVFGQIYQTGADSYQLFLIWTILILPWVWIARSLPLWCIWIVLLNITMLLYWTQIVYGNNRTDDLIFSLLMIINTIILYINDRFSNNSNQWIEGRWLRIVLVLYLLMIAIVPLYNLVQIITLSRSTIISTNFAMVISGVIAALLHVGLIWTYCIKQTDMWIVALTGISIAIHVCDFMYHFLLLMNLAHAIFLALMLMSILTIFTLTAFFLRNIHNRYLYEARS